MAKRIYVGSKRIYVGNLPFSTTSEQVTGLFSKYGTVDNVKLETKGTNVTAYVEMNENAEVGKIIDALNDKPFMGKKLEVKKS